MTNDPITKWMIDLSSHFTKNISTQYKTYILNKSIQICFQNNYLAVKICLDVILHSNPTERAKIKKTETTKCCWEHDTTGLNAVREHNND